MKTIEMTFDEPLLLELDNVVQELKIDRIAFIRDALQSALQVFQIRRLEEKHRQGYLLHPVEPEEFEIWQSEPIWSDV